jgi:ketosteroid isomerase-like protein
MSEENVEVVKRLFSALEADDLATALQVFDAEVEWSPMEGTYHGIEGVGASFIEWMEPWDEHRIEPEEFLQGDDRVLVSVHLTARGRGSGMEVDQHFFQVYTVRDEKISRMVEYVDRARALEAAGLAE